MNPNEFLPDKVQWGACKPKCYELPKK
jgi:hypothetical protein